MVLNDNLSSVKTNDLVFNFIQTRDSYSFVELISRHKGIIHGAISKFSALKEHEREDVYQDSVLRILESIPRFNIGSSKFSTWAYSCAKNASMHQLSENRKRGFLIKASQQSDTEPISFLERKGPTVENFWENDKFLDGEELKKARSSLTLDENQLLVWAYDEGLSYPEIGKKLGKSRQAVYSKLIKIYGKLRSLLKGLV